MKLNDLKYFLVYLFERLKNDTKKTIAGLFKVKNWERALLNSAVFVFFFDLWTGRRDTGTIVGFLILWLVAMLYNEYKAGNWRRYKKVEVYGQG